MRIHPTAIIDSSAEIDNTVEIGPYCIVGKNVKISKNTVLTSNVHIMDFAELGENNIIHVGAIIGHEPQHLEYKYCASRTIIGDNNIIREYASIHRGLKEGSATIIGNNNFLMGFSHIGHDVTIGDFNVLANTAALAGHVQMGSYNFMSGYSGVHQFTRIGDYIMISGLTRVGKDVPPYMLVEGYCEVRGINVIGLRRRGFTAEQRAEIVKAYKILYRSGLNKTQALEEMKRHTWTEAGMRLIDFISAPSKRGIARHYKSKTSESAQDEGKTEE